MLHLGVSQVKTLSWLRPKRRFDTSTRAAGVRRSGPLQGSTSLRESGCLPSVPEPAGNCAASTRHARTLFVRSSSLAVFSFSPSSTVATVRVSNRVSKRGHEREIGRADVLMCVITPLGVCMFESAVQVRRAVMRRNCDLKVACPRAQWQQCFVTTWLQRRGVRSRGSARLQNTRALAWVSCARLFRAGNACLSSCRLCWLSSSDEKSLRFIGDGVADSHSSTRRRSSCHQPKDMSRRCGPVVSLTVRASHHPLQRSTTEPTTVRPSRARSTSRCSVTTTLRASSQICLLLLCSGTLIASPSLIVMTGSECHQCRTASNGLDGERLCVPTRLEGSTTLQTHHILLPLILGSSYARRRLRASLTTLVTLLMVGVHPRLESRCCRPFG